MAALVGESPHRVEGRDKVTGRATYAAEFEVPGLVHAVIVRSPIAAGRARRIDDAAASAAPGVVAVLAQGTFPKLRDAPVALQSGSERNRMSGSAGQQFLPLQGDQILYPGQPVALVVADTLEHARHAASLVRLDLQQAKPIVDLEQAREESELFAPKNIWGSQTDHHRGDVPAALDAAAVRVDATYLTQVQHHVPIEMHATIAWWTDGGTRLHLYEPTTWVYGVQKSAATWFGLRPEQVRVVQEHVGGSFGSKGPTWPHVALCAGAAHVVGRPVRLELTRPQTFTSNGYRPRIEHRVALGATRYGDLVALQYDTVAETGRFDDRAVAPTTKTPPRVYACPNVRTSYRLARINRSGPFTFRAPGEAPGMFALESAIDELAYALKIDPLELRQRNYAEQDPDEGQPWSSKSLRACYEQAAARFGWSARKAGPRQTREGDEWVGVGMATMLYDVRSSPTKATATLDAAGIVTIRTATCDQGVGSRTALSQLAADAAGGRLDQLRFLLGDTDLPLAPLQAGSQTTASVGTAVTRAGARLRERLIALATRDVRSPLHGLDVQQLVVEDGVIRSTVDTTAISFARLIELNGGREMTGEGEAQQINELEDVSRFSFGAHFAEVRVHAVTGRTRVTRWTAGFGAGRIINPRLAHDQLVTGIIWGIGQALMEETHVDKTTGRLVNEDLAEYHVPTNADVPPADVIDAFFVPEHDDKVNPVGVKGVGEVGAIGSAAAIANAVFHATGIRVRDLPITADKLLGQL